MIAYVEPLSGASGDMLLGALLDVGLSSEALRDALHTLPLPDWRLESRPVRRGAIGATQALVVTEERDAPTRGLAEVLGMIDQGRLPGAAASQARAIFTRLAECEAHVHRTSMQEIHFHEVGAADAIADICGVTAGLALLEVEHLYCGPLPLNSGGWVAAAHGRLPLPAPATLELLARAEAPTIPHPAQVELLTPTGAAILTVLARFERPAMRLHAAGYGAGGRTEPEPNVLRLTLGEPSEAAEDGESTERLNMLACNIDDMNPQWYGHLYELLLARGALDVTCVPALMKKGRPGQVLSVLCREADRSALSNMLLRETTTLGVRDHSVTRRAAARAMTSVDTAYGKVPVKLRLTDGRVTQAIPEYDECRALAVTAGATLAAVTMAAQAAAYPLFGSRFESEENR
jgi:pyridinium-3,5-bisthiocarboxylic acid mononucleotide nickel chelatase